MYLCIDIVYVKYIIHFLLPKIFFHIPLKQIIRRKQSLAIYIIKVSNEGRYLSYKFLFRLLSKCHEIQTCFRFFPLLFSLIASDLAPYPKKTMSGLGCSNSNSTKAFSSTAKVSFIFHCTGKSLLEALIFALINPQYDKRLFIELQVQYMKIPSSNLGTT